jgi:hypothetical protein
MQRYVDHSIDKGAIKALVAVYGPREAARQAGLPQGTVLYWATKYKWRKADRIPRSTGINGMSGIIPKDAGDAISDAMAQHKEEATVRLAQYTAKAARKASQLKDPLEKARNVRDVAAVYRAVWPEEQGGEMVEGAILVGGAAVRDNPVEMLALTTPGDVREELSDQRPQGD